jgi:hypothetical protein
MARFSSRRRSVATVVIAIGRERLRAWCTSAADASPLSHSTRITASWRSLKAGSALTRRLRSWRQTTTVVGSRQEPRRTFSGARASPGAERPAGCRIHRGVCNARRGDCRHRRAEARRGLPGCPPRTHKRFRDHRRDRRGLNADCLFVTAYDRHTLKAFEVHALDYVLRPVDSDRLRGERLLFIEAAQIDWIEVLGTTCASAMAAGPT